ncbi:MAG: hypothetical protein H0U98_06710 [Alphaproteobacteria bacterium]|nr:hypothetical protein [Alphaproteobacteria bacterium]
MADQEILPNDYESWLEYAERAASEIEGAGGRFIRVFIDPNEFPRWCRTRGLLPDGRARTRFANFIAFREALSADNHH